jgi:hypothetical protein
VDIHYVPQLHVILKALRRLNLVTSVHRFLSSLGAIVEASVDRTRSRSTSSTLSRLSTSFRSSSHRAM